MCSSHRHVSMLYFGYRHVCHLLLTVVIFACAGSAAALEVPRTTPSIRRPVDLITVGQHLVVACESPASLVVCDARTGQEQSLTKLDGVPKKLVRLGNDQWLVVDATNHQLIWYELSAMEPQRIRKIDCIQDPMDVAVTAKGLVVSGRWSRQVACYAPSQPWQHDYHEVWKTNLDFSPGCLHPLLPEGLIVAADQYGSQWATLRMEDGIESFRHQFFGHRMRGFIEDPNGYLVVSHQLLNATSRTVKEDLHWGITLSNDVRWLRRDHITSPHPQRFFKDSRIDRIGEVGNGSAEPNDLCVAADGTVVVVCGGSNEVAIGKLSDFALQRTTVDFNPVAVTLTADESLAWIACRFDNSLVAVDLKTRQLQHRISFSSSHELTSVERGERLFHDATLSHDGWMTCASCHPDGHTIHDRSDNLGDGDYGSPKRIPSLLGRSGTAPYGWLGSDETLQAQLRRSIRHTMQSDRQLSDFEMADMVAYLSSLSAPPSLAESRKVVEDQLVAEGKEIFRRKNCVDCHQSPNLTSSDLHDVGTSDAGGRHAFNPPSLIGVSQAGPGYLHDGRAGSLRDVFTKHLHPWGSKSGEGGSLTEQELAALLKYLETL